MSDEGEEIRGLLRDHGRKGADFDDTLWAILSKLDDAEARGFRRGIEAAAELAESNIFDKQEGGEVAAAIRKLEPKP